MKNHKKYIIILICTFIFSPFVVKADVIGDLQSQIQSLLSQVKALQEQIKSIRLASSTEMFASTTPRFMNERNNEGDDEKFCVPIARNIGFGSRGDDVKMIQKMLASDPTLYNGSTTGYFGFETQKAMVKFQQKYGIASTTTGFFGPLTRNFLDQKCSYFRASINSMSGQMMGTTTNLVPKFQGNMMNENGGERNDR